MRELLGVVYGVLIGATIAIVVSFNLRLTAVSGGWALAWLLVLGMVAGGALGFAIVQTVKLYKVHKFFYEFVSQRRFEFEKLIDQRLQADAQVVESAHQYVVNFQKGSLESIGIDPMGYRTVELRQARIDQESQRLQYTFKGKQAWFYNLYDLALFFSENFCYLNLRERKFGSYLKSLDEYQASKGDFMAS